MGIASLSRLSPADIDDIVDRGVRHAVSSVRRAPIARSPSPHFYIDEVFTPELFQLIRQHFPTPTQFLQMMNSDHGNYEINPNRYYLSYCDEDHLKLPEESRKFWSAFFRKINNSRVSEIISRKFGFLIDVPRKTFLGQHPEILLIDDRSGYAIGPHHDTSPKLWSALFYLPEDRTKPEIGTSMFVKKGEALRSYPSYDAWLYRGGDPLHSFSEFEKVWTAPYLPNSMFCFARTRRSYHGVEPTGPGIARQLMILECFSMRDSRKRARGAPRS